MRLALTLGLLIASSDAPASERGPTPGQPAPAFTLPDQNGKERSLDSLITRGVLAIVFFRSSDW